MRALRLKVDLDQSTLMLLSHSLLKLLLSQLYQSNNV